MPKSPAALELRTTPNFQILRPAIGAMVDMAEFERACEWVSQWGTDEGSFLAGKRGGSDRLRGRHRYDFLMPVDLELTRKRDPLISDLASSRNFRRLKEVRFLGALDYVFVPSPNGAPKNRRHTRYSHSLGVMHLAKVFSDKVDLGERERRLILAAALLHDVGHAPFSHTLEPFFEKYFRINHHRTTIDVVTGEEHTDGEIPRILENHGVDPAEVAAVLNGDNDPTGGFFSGPINFDTIEAILRSCTYVPKHRLVLNPIGVMIAALERSSEDDCEIVDQFWLLKKFVYKHIIQSELGLLADEAFRSIADKYASSLTPQDFFSRETTLFRKLPDLQRAKIALYRQERVDSVLDTNFSFKKRDFFINPHSSFFSRADAARYRQIKENRVFLGDATRWGGASHAENSYHDSLI